jgi:hypothetical protein
MRQYEGSKLHAESQNGGRMALKGHEFSELMRPVIDELHNKTQPTAQDLPSGAYTALIAAGIDVTLKPPLQGHGTWSARSFPNRLRPLSSGPSLRGCVP